MQVKSIAECSKGSILQYFQPLLSYHLSLRHLFCLFLSGTFFTGFTVIQNASHAEILLFVDLVQDQAHFVRLNEVDLNPNCS